MESINYVETASIALLVMFDATMVCRVVKIIFDGMADEELPTKNRLINCAKAIIVVNCISGLIIIIKSYY